MDKFFKKTKIKHYDNDVILNHPYVQSLLVKKDYEQSWNLRLFDLKSVLPNFYNWVEIREFRIFFICRMNSRNFGLFRI